MYFLLNYVGNNFSAIKTFKCMLIKYFHAPSVLLDEWCQFNLVILANLSTNKKLWKVLISHQKDQTVKYLKWTCIPKLRYLCTVQTALIFSTLTSCIKAFIVDCSLTKMTTLVYRGKVTANNSEWWTNGDMGDFTLVSCQRQSCNTSATAWEWLKNTRRFLMVFTWHKAFWLSWLWIRVWRTGTGNFSFFCWYRNRYRNKLVPEKSLGTGIGQIWYR